MIGFNLIITLDDCGKVTDYNKSYNNFYAKKVTLFLPMKYSFKMPQTPHLLTAINETYPLDIEDTIGKKSETDLNCYCFDVTNMYNKYCDDGRIGLTRFILRSADDNTQLFTSQTFRV